MNNLFMKKRAFTLLELIVVIIIIGVLAGLALPKLYSAIERSRSAEAIVALSAWRAAIERCMLWTDGDFEQCLGGGFPGLDIDSPFEAPGSHFEAHIAITCMPLHQGFVLEAKRRFEPGLNDPGGTIHDTVCYSSSNLAQSRVVLTYDIDNNIIEIKGSGFYEGI